MCINIDRWPSETARTQWKEMRQMKITIEFAQTTKTQTNVNHKVEPFAKYFTAN